MRQNNQVFYYRDRLVNGRIVTEKVAKYITLRGVVEVAEEVREREMQDIVLVRDTGERRPGR